MSSAPDSSLLDNTTEANVGNYDNVTELRRDAGVPEDDRTASLEVDSMVATLAEAFSTTRLSSDKQLQKVPEFDGGPLVTSVRPGSSHSPEANDYDVDAMEEARSAHAYDLSSLDDWQIEPEAVFGQVYLPVRDFNRLNEQRMNLVATQVKARELRKALRGQRATIAEQQQKLLQDLRILALTGGKRDLDQLLEQLEEAQELHEALQQGEESFDEIEARLIDQEWDLKNAELRLYRRGIDDMSGPEDSQILAHPEPATSGVPPFVGSGAELPLASQPADSDIDKLRIQLRDLESEHRQLMHEEKLRNDIGLSLDEDSSFTLRIFPFRHADILQNLTRYEERLAEKEYILNHSVILDTSMDQFPTYQYTGDDLEVLARMYTTDEVRENASPASDALTLSSWDVTRCRDALLLPATLLGDTEPSSSAFPNFAKSEDHGLPQTLTFINDWLLYTLRSSSLAISNLRGRLTGSLMSTEPQTGKLLIISFWYQDNSDIEYIESAERAAQSLNPTVLSQGVATDLQQAYSDPNLAAKQCQSSIKGSRNEVGNVSLALMGLTMTKLD